MTVNKDLSVGEDMEKKREPLHTVDRMKLVWKITEPSYNPAGSTIHSSEEMKNVSPSDVK